MHFLYLILILTLGTITPSGGQSQTTFLDHYSDYCGSAYSGETTFVDLSSGHLFEDVTLTMILSECSSDKIKIPFHVGEDRSRTWIIESSPEGLLLSHDHRNEDGTAQADNMYGGYSISEPGALRQSFPASKTTIEDRPSRAINVWEKAFDPVNNYYYYRLFLDGELRLEARFDLSDPVEIKN